MNPKSELFVLIRIENLVCLFDLGFIGLRTSFGFTPIESLGLSRIQMDSILLGLKISD